MNSQQKCTFVVSKGYTAQIEFSPADNCFMGHLSDIKDIVGFHGETIAEAEAAFGSAVEDYLEMCDRIGKAPQAEPIV